MVTEEVTHERERGKQVQGEGWEKQLTQYSSRLLGQEENRSLETSN